MLLILAAVSVVGIAGSAYAAAPKTPQGICQATGGTWVSISFNANHCIGGTTGTTKNPIYDYIHGFFLWMSGLVGLIIAIAYIISGYQWMTSAGSPDRLKKAKVRIGQATISLLLFIFMAAILSYLVPGIF
jgi:hypothetical protein